MAWSSHQVSLDGEIQSLGSPTRPDMKSRCRSKSESRVVKVSPTHRHRTRAGLDGGETRSRSALRKNQKNKRKNSLARWGCVSNSSCHQLGPASLSIAPATQSCSSQHHHHSAAAAAPPLPLVRLLPASSSSLVRTASLHWYQPSSIPPTSSVTAAAAAAIPRQGGSQSGAVRA